MRFSLTITSSISEMLSRAVHRQCALCCKSLPAPRNVHMVSQGRNSNTLSRCLPFSSSSDLTHPPHPMIVKCNRLPQTGSFRSCATQVLPTEPSKHTTETPTDHSTSTANTVTEASAPVSRTLWLRIPNSDVITETLQQLSADIVDVELYHRTKGHSYAFLVFGSEETAERNYNKLKAIGLNLEYMDVLRRTLWIDFGTESVTVDSIKQQIEDQVDVQLTQKDGKSFAYVVFPSEHAARSNKKKFTKAVLDERTETVIQQADYSRSLWLGYFDSNTTVEQLQGLSRDNINVIWKTADDQRRYAFLEFESADLAEQNYHQLTARDIKVKHVRDEKPKPKVDRECTLYMPIGKKEMTRESLNDLSGDIIEAHIIDHGKALRYAYLKFASKEETKKNYNLLKEQGYAVYFVGELKKVTSSSTSTEDEILPQTDTPKTGDQIIPQSHDTPKTVDPKVAEVSNNPSMKKGERKPSLQNRRITYDLFLGNLERGITHADIKALSDDITKVRVQYRRTCFAYLEFASLEKCRRNLELLAKMGMDVNYAGQEATYERHRQTLCLLESTLTEEELRKLSNDIVSVHMVTKGEQRYTNIVLPSEQSREDHYKLFKNQNMNVVRWKERQRQIRVVSD